MRDRFFINFVIIVLTLCIVSTNAYCFYVDSSMKLENVSLTEDLLVADTGKFSSSRTDVDRSVSISNRGVINSDFYIDDGVRVYVQNSGTINGAFHVAADSSLVQVVQSAADITYIDVSSNFSVLVQDADNLYLSDVFDVGTDADKIILDNSTLVLDGPHRRRLNADPRAIEIVGDVILKLDSADGLDCSAPALHNVSGTGRVLVEVADINPLYKIVTGVDDGDMYMKMVRETDYAKIFENDVGRFLNSLRRVWPGDKLLSAMDNASDIETLNSIMTDSVRLNPIKLMAPVRRMHMLDVSDGWRYSDMDVIHVNADIIFSDASSTYRAGAVAAVAIARNVYAAIGGHVGLFDVSDDINDFSGYVYGARMNMRFDDGLIVGNLLAGISRADFIADCIFDGDTVVDDPSGMAGYAAMDIGAYLFREHDLTIAPFAGVMTHYMSVLNASDTIALANCGIDINLSEHEFDILYDYGIRGNVLTDGTGYVGTFIKFAAPDDDVGGELNTAVIHDESGTGYKISISAHVLF